MAVGRILATPLLVVNFGVTVVVLGLAGHMLDLIISDPEYIVDDSSSGLDGNEATFYLVLFAILGGVASIAAIITGLIHVAVWNSRSGAAAQATAWISWTLVALAFCLVCKEIYVPGGRGFQLRVLEICVIVLTSTQFLYCLTLYIGGRPRRNNGPGPSSAGR